MKKKIELKSIAIISLFIVGITLLILGNKSPYCLGFGMIVLGAACFLYAFEKIKALNKRYIEMSDEFYAYDGNNIEIINEYSKQMKVSKKQIFRTKLVFYVFSVLLVIIGFLSIM